MTRRNTRYHLSNLPEDLKSVLDTLLTFYENSGSYGGLYVQNKSKINDALQGWVKNQSPGAADAVVRFLLNIQVLLQAPNEDGKPVYWINKPRFDILRQTTDSKPKLPATTVKEIEGIYRALLAQATEGKKKDLQARAERKERRKQEQQQAWKEKMSAEVIGQLDINSAEEPKKVEEKAVEQVISDDEKEDDFVPDELILDEEEKNIIPALSQTLSQEELNKLSDDELRARREHLLKLAQLCDDELQKRTEKLKLSKTILERRTMLQKIKNGQITLRSEEEELTRRLEELRREREETEKVERAEEEAIASLQMELEKL